jgi:hypothetical protein
LDKNQDLNDFKMASSVKKEKTYSEDSKSPKKA